MVALQYWWLQTLLHTDWTPLMLLMSLTDLPKDIYDYVHRIGRSGRPGKSGLATAFFSDKNLPLAKALVELMQESIRKFILGSTNMLRDQLGLAMANVTGQAGLVAMTTEMLNHGSENYNYSSNYEGSDSSFDASVGSSYGASNAGPAGGDECSVAANADSYAPCGYAPCGDLCYDAARP